jgi:hypothetical protein
MTEQKREVLVPLEQATVMLFGHPVLAVRLPDGRIAAVFTDLCSALDLDRASQARRVRTDEVLSDQFVMAEVTHEDLPQPSDVLTAWAIPTWLTGIQLSRLALEKRSTILAFKREAADVLYRHFSQPQQALSSFVTAPEELPSPATLVPSEPINEPSKPAKDADTLTWADYYEQMASWLRWQVDLEKWQTQTSAQLAEHEQQIGELHSRMEGHEEISRMLVQALDRLGPEPLSPAHQQTVKALVKRLHEVGGFAFATIYSDLGAAFHVAKYDQIEERQWSEVAEWFKQRIEAAEKHQKYR